MFDNKNVIKHFLIPRPVPTYIYLFIFTHRIICRLKFFLKEAGEIYTNTKLDNIDMPLYLAVDIIQIMLFISVISCQTISLLVSDKNKFRFSSNMIFGFQCLLKGCFAVQKWCSREYEFYLLIIVIAIS